MTGVQTCALPIYDPSFTQPKMYDLILVPRQSEPLIQAAVDLPLQLPDRPLLTCRLDFVKAARVRVPDPHQDQVIRPAQRESGQCGLLLFGFVDQWLAN